MVSVEKKVVKLSYLLSEAAFSSGLIAHSVNRIHFLALGVEFLRYTLSTGWQTLVLLINRDRSLFRMMMNGTDICVVEVLDLSDLRVDDFENGQFPTYFVVGDQHPLLEEIRGDALEGGYELMEVSSDGLDGVLKGLGEGFLAEKGFID